MINGKDFKILVFIIEYKVNKRNKKENILLQGKTM